MRRRKAGTCDNSPDAKRGCDRLSKDNEELLEKWSQLVKLLPDKFKEVRTELKELKVEYDKLKSENDQLKKAVKATMLNQVGRDCDPDPDLVQRKKVLRNWVKATCFDKQRVVHIGDTQTSRVYEILEKIGGLAGIMTASKDVIDDLEAMYVFYSEACTGRALRKRRRHPDAVTLN